jgi:hypothetical protein
MNFNGIFSASSWHLSKLERLPVKTLVACLLLLVACWAATAQEQPPAPAPTPAPEATNEFVSGTITDLPPGKIVVSRAVLGKPPEDRTFLINADTIVEGKLRKQARVTVGFKATEEGDVAMRIIVRNGAPSPKP